MLYIKEANFEDLDKEYLYIRDLSSDENGFTNPYFGISRGEFKNKILKKIINNSKGIDLPEGYVACTEFFLWEDDTIVGLFRIRHELNRFLKEGPGHIGYGIKKEFRGRGLASKGLKLIIEKAKKLIKEDKIYMSVNKNNYASLKVQMKNGAYIHHEDEEHYYTRIKIR
ncbi:MAG: GNAT family N-acetyltransferase [Peptoniphilaceae bacterium]